MKNPPLLLLLAFNALAASAATGFRVALAQELAIGTQNAARPTSVQLWLNENGDLHYDDLTTIDPTTAETIVAFAAKSGCEFAYLSLNGLSTLDAASAAALADFEGANLFLCGLTTVDVATARSLAQCKCRDLALGGLTTVGPGTAMALAEFRGNVLYLEGVATLDAEAATNLAKFKGVMLSVGVRELDAPTAKALAAFKGRQLNLSHLTTLEADTAKALTEYPGRLEFRPEVVQEFCAKHPLSPETATMWACVLAGRLNNITALQSSDSVGIAKAFTAWRGPLYLRNLKRASPETLAVLMEKQNIELPPIKTIEVIPEPNANTAEDPVMPGAP